MEIDLVAEVFELGGESFALRRRSVSVRCCGPGGDGEDRLLGPAAGLDAEELHPQVAVLRAGSGPGRSDQRGLEPVPALADARRAALAGALTVAGAEPGPRHE